MRAHIMSSLGMAPPRRTTCPKMLGVAHAGARTAAATATNRLAASPYVVGTRRHVRCLQRASA